MGEWALEDLGLRVSDDEGGWGSWRRREQVGGRGRAGAGRGERVLERRQKVRDTDAEREIQRESNRDTWPGVRREEGKQRGHPEAGPEPLPWGQAGGHRASGEGEAELPTWGEA